jgi:ParB-like chromosome segregation protein Spo0J
MRLTLPEQINMENRARQEFQPKELAELKRSILSKGLLHAPVLSKALVLLAGERRIRAMLELHEEGNTFSHDGEVVPPGQIPYSLVQDLSPEDFLEAELEENTIRAELTWQEQTTLRVRIHELRRLQNPAQTQSETAEEIAKISGKPEKTEQARLARAITIEKHKDDPRVQNAPSESAAYRAILDRSNAQFKKQLAAIEGFQSPHEIIHGDAFDVLPTLPEKQYDAIICDPPYGIDADKMGKEGQHFYDDSAAYALKFCKFIFTQGFRLTKSQALLFMFCDPEHFKELKEYAQMQAWTVWRTPLVWYKIGEGGNAPWGRGGFVRSSEFILFASKGGQELRNPGGSDVLPYRRVARGSKTHAAEKPADLLEKLVSVACLPDANLLDPCCGSGSILRAADKHKIRVTGIELDETYHAEAAARATEGFDPDKELDEDEEPEEPSLNDLLGAKK